MTAFEDGLWTRLVEEHDADRVALQPASEPSSKRPLLIGGGLTSLAAVTAAGVVALTAATSPPPAYALTQNPDGSITVTINDLESAVPALNARFAAMGIDETVVPVEASCPTTGDASQFPGVPLFVAPQETTSDTLTFSVGHKYLEAGYTGVVAAEQLPDGEVAMAVGAIRPPVPSCFPTTAYRLRKTGTTNGIPSYQATPANTSTTTPGG
jgi:hypothetical protein